MERATIPERTVLLAVLTATGGLAAQVPPSSAVTERLGAPEAWEAFRTYWRQIDQDAFSAPYHRYMLAQRLGMTEEAFGKALRQTERRASDPSQTGALALGDYALASLAELRLTLSSTLQPPLYIRMAILPPDVRSAQHLRGMERIEQRVEELGDLKVLPRETLQAALEGLRMDVYRYCALRVVASAHARTHPPPHGPKEGESAEHALLWAFFWHSEASTVGSRAWFQRYGTVMDRLLERMDPALRAEIRSRHRDLAASIDALEAARPGLETLIAELEHP